MTTNTASDRNTQINTLIYDRNIPTQIIQPYISVRPVMTKYSILPIVDPRKPNNVMLNQLPTYNLEKVFNPGNKMSPWSGYSSNINVESELKGQIFALQSCDQSVYVPKSNSDLYNYAFKPSNVSLKGQSHSLLFKEEKYDRFNPIPDNMHLSLFNNSTRNQIQDLL
jgi:hypothetical protein